MIRNPNDIVELIPEWQMKNITIESLSGGMTNSNFKISVDGFVFFASISGSKSQLLGIDWDNKFYNAKICGDAGISPKIMWHFQLQRVLVQEFLTMRYCSVETLQSRALQSRLVDTIKVLHSGEKFWRDFDMFSLIQNYVEIIKVRKLALPEAYVNYKKNIWESGKVLAPYREELVPCHNDLVPENIMDDGNRVFLLDFDYSGNNDPCFDLGSISVEAGYDDMQIRELARTYLGSDLISENIIARIHLHGILGDIGWSLWSVIQENISEIDFDFQKYGVRRWNRAVKKMNSSKFPQWLRNMSR